MDELQHVSNVIGYIQNWLNKGGERDSLPLIQFKQFEPNSYSGDVYIQPGMKAEIFNIKYLKKEGIYLIYCFLFRYSDFNRQFQKNFYDESPWTTYFTIRADDADKQIKDLIIMPIKGSASISNVDPDLSLVVGN